MATKIEYVRAATAKLKSQIDQHQVALGALANAIQGAESLLSAREALGEVPVRSNIEGQFLQLQAAIAQINLMTLIAPSQSAFMAGYDAAQ